MKNNEELQTFNDEMPTNPVQPPVRVEIGNLTNMVNTISSRIYNLEQIMYRVGQRLDAIEQQPAETPVRKTKKEQPAQPQQPVPVWQQKPVVSEEKEEPKKKPQRSPTKMIAFIILAIILVFIIGNCQAIMSYLPTGG